MNFRALRTVWSGAMLRYGDCSNCTASACLSVPSKTASPVVLTKSARTIESFSVSFVPECDRQYRPAPTSVTIAAAATIAPSRFGAGTVVAAAEDSGVAGAAATPEPEAVSATVPAPPIDPAEVAGEFPEAEVD